MTSVLQDTWIIWKPLVTSRQHTMTLSAAFVTLLLFLVDQQWNISPYPELPIVAVFLVGWLLSLYRTYQHGWRQLHALSHPTATTLAPVMQVLVDELHLNPGALLKAQQRVWAYQSAQLTEIQRQHLATLQRMITRGAYFFLGLARILSIALIVLTITYLALSTTIGVPLLTVLLWLLVLSGLAVWYRHLHNPWSGPGWIQEPQHILLALRNTTNRVVAPVFQIPLAQTIASLRSTFLVYMTAMVVITLLDHRLLRLCCAILLVAIMEWPWFKNQAGKHPPENTSAGIHRSVSRDEADSLIDFVLSLGNVEVEKRSHPDHADCQETPEVSPFSTDHSESQQSQQ